MDLPAAKEQERFVFIDALRGVAALGVMYHHMLHNSVMEVTLRRILPYCLALLSGWGAYGVEIFFVLSGFVITHSLRHTPVDGKAIGRFIVRRQLRLDPPYWCALAFTLAFQAIRRQLPNLVTPALPHLGTVALNLFYLQNIIRVEQVMSVAWTLCIEVQFYLVFIGVLVLAAQWKTVGYTRAAKASMVVAASGCLSLGSLFIVEMHAWFVPYWFYFASGALCYWAVRGLISRWVFCGYAAIAGIVFAMIELGVKTADAGHESFFLLSGGQLMNTGHAGGPRMIVGIGTVILIYVVGRAGRLTTLWSHPIIQYFGRISYSLYLVHVAVAVGVLQAGYKLTGENEKMALIWFVLSGVASIIAGHLLFVSVERPVMRLASRFKRRPVTVVDNDLANDPNGIAAAVPLP